ncbi:maestro heat-like repeat-containing protein family member 2B [Elgaria multicarinata webbii]|uniref:maestro heat-like repeat-containing protein family member 2B n=1 Tax=Elgaria multicarinata webbii TaxID=159646 RepID=UPI002FCD046C
MDPLIELKIKKEIYDYITFRLECLQNADQAAQDIIRKADGKTNIKLAVNILAEEMVKEETPEKTRVQASSVLLALGNSHFNDVMYELQRNVRAGPVPHHMVFKTLGNLASHYALKCIPFLSLTFLYIRVMIRLPIISHMKEEICYVMENFCAAINYYYKNWRVCSFPREAESQLCSPVIPIYHCLVSDWLNDEEMKVKEASVKAQWPMLGVLVRRREQQEEIIRTLPKVLLESKILDSYFVAKRLGFFLDVCEDCKPPIPKKTFQALCDFVFQQVLPLDTTVQRLKKPQKTVDRFTYQSWKPEIEETSVERQVHLAESATSDQCGYEHQRQLSSDQRHLLMEAFSHLVCWCPTDALDFLQNQMKDAAEHTRVGVLNNLRMIVGSDQTGKTGNRKRPIVEAVKCLLDDRRETVRKAILGFIKELLRSQSVEGCAVWDMVAYVFQQFNVSVSQQGKDFVADQKEKERIQEMCIDVLEHLNTSAEGMSKALWPRLLLFVVPAPYTPTLIPLCRCLKELALIRQDESALFLGSCKGVNLPSAQGIVARLLVLASNPGPRGAWALQLLHALHCNIHTAIRKLWAKQLPFLLKSFQGKDPEVSSYEWEQNLLQFLRRSLETIDDSTWIQNLTRELDNQMDSYADQSTEKSFLYKSLGISLTSCEDQVFVQSRIQHLVENTDYMEAAEREKVVEILSFSAIGHLDLTLATLHEFGAGMCLKMKVSAIISRYKDYHKGRRGHVHQTLMLTYGKVALHAPKELLFLRVETDIMTRVLYHYRNSCQVLGVNIENRDMNLKLALVQSTSDICHAIHETRDVQDFKLTCKKELLDILLDFIREEPLVSLESPLRSKAITAIASLSKLKPQLTMEDIRNLLDQSIKSLFPLPSLEQLKEKGETESDALCIESLYTCSMDAFGKLIKSITEEHPTSELLDEMFQLIDPWFTETECSRERALQATFQVLAAFQENVHLSDGENFQQFGSRVAFLAPYTCDDSIRCRKWAAQCIICLMHIQAQARITSVEEKEMSSVCTDLQTDVPGDLFRASSRMAKMVSAYFPPDQALDFIEAILEDLVSGNEKCAIAAGRWLLTLLQDCGKALEAQISAILDIFYSRLPTIKQDDLRQVLVGAVSIVAHYHLEAVFNSLLGRRLPMDSETGELWRSLGSSDPSLASFILHKLAARITQPTILSTPSQTSMEETEELADEEPLIATCAVYEVLSVVKVEKVIEEEFPELFCALLWQVSKTLGQKMPFHEGRRRLFLREQRVSEGNPCRLSVASLKALVLKVTCDPSLAEIGDVNTWALLRDPRAHQKGVCLLTSHLLQNRCLGHGITQTILPWMTSGSKKLQLTGIAFFTEVIHDPMFGEREQLKSFLPILMERAGDQHHGIRQMAIKALGNVLLAAPDKVKEKKKAIAAIFLGALYDAHIALEGLTMLAQVFPFLKGKDVGFLFNDISMKTITYLADDNSELRGAALRLFGILAGWTTFRYKAFFGEQVKKNLVPLLIHQHDPSPKVSEACRAAFLQSVRFLAKKKLRVHIEELYRSTSLSLPNLHMHLCRQLVNINPEMKAELLNKAVTYFQSSCEEIRTRALELSGIILESMQIADLDEATRQLLLTSLERLQEDPSNGLQQAAADLKTYVFKKWGRELPRRKEALIGDPTNATQMLGPYCVPRPGTILEATSVQDLYE